MNLIRPAQKSDLERIAEIEVFNYRLNFYPIFRNDTFYFSELRTSALAAAYAKEPAGLYVYDDGVVRGFVQVVRQEIRKLFVEPVLQSNSIGAALLCFATEQLHADHLWALEKNTRAIAFYERHGFHLTADKKPEEGTHEYLVRLMR
ncbi:MAG: GNAT family N-acetyltransferase [Clostridiales bacterium]|nr:GNAT family N-acetyltransferase [Clostridiales bacterium]